MSARSFVAAAAIGALALVLAVAGIGRAADGGHQAPSASKGSKAKRGRRGPRGAVGPAGAPGKDGAAGKAGPAGGEGPVGPEGPGAIISIENLELRDPSVNHDPQFAFVGETLTATFDARTTAQVTASLDFASHDGKRIESAFAICADPAAGTGILAFRAVSVTFQAPGESYFAQTASATLQGLAPGSYTIGACTARETMNVGHGRGVATVILAEADGPRPT